MLRTPQTAIISGASSGIGAEIAKRFSEEGYELLLFGRNSERLAKVQAECASTTRVLAFDLTETARHLDAIRNELGGLAPPHVIVNNAGVFDQSLLEDSDDDLWSRHFQVNLLSAVQLTRLVWPIFKKQQRGCVVNVASTLGLKPTATTGAYSATKAALINWTQSLAQEGGAYNIRANCICPGIVDTPIHSFHELEPQKKMEITRGLARHQLLNFIGQPRNIADAACFLSTEESKWTTGAVLTVDGGIHIK